MTDVLLINPAQGDAIYQGLPTACEPPLWVRLIAGYLRDRGWDVAIWDQDSGAPQRACVPRLVVIVAHGHQPSASAQTMASVADLVRQWARVSSVAICGGTPSALPEKALKETGADHVIVGEGPAQIDGILRTMALPKGCDDPAYWPGIVGAAPLLTAADLHGDAWDLLPMDRYRAHNWQVLDGSPRSPYASIYTSLGCPFACSFCCINAPFGGRGYRTRKPEDVVEEVRMLHDDYGVSTIKITDEMFVLKPSHYLPICEGLAALPFADELNIWAYARIDTVKPDTLSLMRRAGIRWLALGIESGSAHVRDGALKKLDDTDIRDTVRAIQDAGISVVGNFIMGLPDDTMESMWSTLLLAQELRCEWANFYCAMAYPGSRLYDETDPQDLPKTWSGYSQHSRDARPLPTATLSAAEVLRFRDEAFRAYFEDPRYLEMLDSKFGPDAVAMVQAMTATRLERDLAA